MSTTPTDPLSLHWPPSTDRATAAELVGRLSTIDLDELGRHRRALAVAVDDLHRDAGSNLRWDERDPTISLMRALPILERLSPQAASSAAHELLRRTPADRHPPGTLPTCPPPRRTNSSCWARWPGGSLHCPTKGGATRTRPGGGG